MRRLLLPFVLVAFALTAHAQQPEQQTRSRRNEIFSPDLNKTFEAGKGSPSSNRSVSTRGARTKEFATTQFSAKAFSARDFAGSKAAYLPKSKVATPSAPTTGRNDMAYANKQAPTKAVPVDAARESSKSMDTRTDSAANRPFLARGRSQDRFDMEAKKGIPSQPNPQAYGGDLRTLTIEEIRELLNKNK